MTDTDHFYKTLTDRTPHPWQSALAAEPTCRNRVIRIPTGLGKTEGVLATWASHLRADQKHPWPRRLVWCLPMRVLVEQTYATARRIIERLKLDERIPNRSLLNVSLLMGGQDAGDWHLHPDAPAVLIGTQDMLLSRTLNRGYGGSRAKWPAEYGLLHQDALWIMDEVQLMDVGLATSAQLQAYRDQDQNNDQKRASGLSKCFTWWMSATLQPKWLHTVDTHAHHADWVRDPIRVPKADRTGGLWQISKKLTTDQISAENANVFAKRILDEHTATAAEQHGHITLAICNTVKRANETFDAIKMLSPDSSIKLVHSRFRPHERNVWRSRFLSREACTQDADRIIIATQVVEAGVDISAGCLVTELAPWPSLVQRFGRCARFGGSGKVLVVDRGHDEKTSPPYSPDQLEGSWHALQSLEDVSINALETYEEKLDDQERGRLYPYAPAHLLLRREFDELFDTTPDLTGADLDISRFIRSNENDQDLQLFWRDVEKDQWSLSEDLQPQRDELCAVPFLQARDWLCGEASKGVPKSMLLKRMRAWVWDWLDGEWKKAERASLLPGRIVCVAAACGGYTTSRGFEPASKLAVTPVPVPEKTEQSHDKSNTADRTQASDALSESMWQTIGFHCAEVAKRVETLAQNVKLPTDLQKILKLAALWHDVGKSHASFQGCIKAEFEGNPGRNDLAKAPNHAWVTTALKRYPCPDNSSAKRDGFRHELASALSLFAVLERFAPDHAALLGPWREIFKELGRDMVPAIQSSDAIPPLVQQVLDLSAEEFDLLVYLVASHHGKVRTALHASPKDQDYRIASNDPRGLPICGIRENDVLPALVLALGGNLPSLSLTLEPAMLGLSSRTGASWRDRTQGLLDRIGPTALAYLEALLRAADVQVSREITTDPVLTATAEAPK